VIIQSTQGFIIYKQYDDQYDQVALSADFIPWTFSVITKKDDEVIIFNDNLFKKEETQYVLQSRETADLDKLFSQRPEARTLY
ncbi:hypothetical protein OSK38_28955, partial [Escherichia coli]|nr:hypothetical protein [Escherichia coli]